MRKSSNSSEFETNYALSDGQVIFDGNGRFWSPDALFIGIQWNGIYETTEGFQQKVLSGGKSTDSDINTILEKEMIQLAQKQ